MCVCERESEIERERERREGKERKRQRDRRYERYLSLKNFCLKVIREKEKKKVRKRD